MQFKISSLVIFSICISFFLKIQEEIIMMFVLDVIHELGHVIMAKIVSLKTSKFTVNIYGTSAVIDNVDYVSPIKQIFIYLGGPLTAFISAILIYAIYKLNFISFYYFKIYNYMNLSLALFNLLPIYPLDGGRIFDVILKLAYPVKKALKIRIFYNSVSICLLMILLIIKRQILMIIIFFLCMISELINYYKSYEEYLKERYSKNIDFEEKISEYPLIYHFRKNVYFIGGEYVKEDRIIEKILLKMSSIKNKKKGVKLSKKSSL